MREAKAWVRPSHRTKDLHPSKRRYEVVYEDPAQNYKQRTKGGFTTKQAARDWAHDHRSSTKRGEYIGASAQRIAFNALANEWLSAQHFDRVRTREGYRKIINGGRSPLNQRFGSTPLADLTHEAVARFVVDLSATRAPQTVRHHYYTLRTVLDYAVRGRRILSNPAYGVRLPRQRKTWEAEEERYPLTNAQTARIVGHLPEPYDMFARLVAATGLRPEEATGLTVGDVNTAHGTVNVKAVIVEENGKLHREEFTKTSKSRRTITLDTVTLGYLRNYLAGHERRARAWFAANTDRTDPGDSLPLFVGMTVGGRTSLPDVERLDYTKPMRYSAFNKRHWHRAVGAAGLPPVRFYDLRHAHASLLVDRIGQPGALTLKEVQQRLGHSSAVMTLDRYAHAGQQDHDKSRTALDAALAPATNDSNVVPIKRGKTG